MNYLIRLFLCLIFLTVIGCTKQSYFPFKTPQQKQCLNGCMQGFAVCKERCVDNCAICSAKADYSAIKNYDEYVHEKIIEGGTITRSLKSYRDPLQCRKVTCNCYADLSICEQTCAGIIHKQLRAVPYCA